MTVVIKYKESPNYKHIEHVSRIENLEFGFRIWDIAGFTIVEPEELISIRA